MTKDMPTSGFELLVYQIGEVQKSISTMSTKNDTFQTQVDLRLTSLEQSRAIAEAQRKDHQGTLFNWMGENALTKIAILALTIALAAIGLVSNGVIK